MFQFSDFLIIQVLRFCARAANAGGTHGLVVGREVWGARFFDPRGLGFESRGCHVSFLPSSLVPAYHIPSPGVGFWPDFGPILATFLKYADFARERQTRVARMV